MKPLAGGVLDFLRWGWGGVKLETGRVHTLANLEPCALRENRKNGSTATLALRARTNMHAITADGNETELCCRKCCTAALRALQTDTLKT